MLQDNVEVIVDLDPAIEDGDNFHLVIGTFE